MRARPAPGSHLSRRPSPRRVTLDLRVYVPVSLRVLLSPWCSRNENTLDCFRKVSSTGCTWLALRAPRPGRPLRTFPDNLAERGAPPSPAQSLPRAQRGAGPVFPDLRKCPRGQQGRQERFTPGLQWLWVNKPRQRAPSITRRPARSAPCAAHMPASRAPARLLPRPLSGASPGPGGNR